MKIDIHFKKKTKRLIIRPYRLEDYETWKQAFSDLPEPKNRWDCKPRSESKLTRIEFKKLLKFQKKSRDSDTFYDFAAFHRKTGEIVGFVSLMDISRAIFQNAYLGYSIFSGHWRQGYGKEMVRAAIDIGFKKLKLHRIEAGIDPANRRSIALAKSLGMRREGLSKRRLFLDGKWCDQGIYALTAEEVGIKPKVKHHVNRL